MTARLITDGNLQLLRRYDNPFTLAPSLPPSLWPLLLHTQVHDCPPHLRRQPAAAAPL